MTPRLILSYDGTPHDTDALVLGREFAELGAELSLAFVRHVTEDDPRAEAVAQQEAEALLQRGAQWLGRPDLARHVVVAGSTGAGLSELAEREGADMVVFGSDWHTPPGTVNPGTSAQRLLDGGRVAVAIAAAHLRDLPDPHLTRIALSGGDVDPAARTTAEELAARVGTELVRPGHDAADLLVIGSRPGTPDGQVGISSASEYLLETAGASVLVVPRATSTSFGTHVAAA
jgi:nucleotide-binding universal stress UspA family protein